MGIVIVISNLKSE